MGPLRTFQTCLDAPFECPPVRLGFGTFIPTSLAAAYRRDSFTTNADGSFSLTYFPTATYPLYWNRAGAGNAPFWNATNSVNQSAITNQFGQARVVASGIRLFPMIAQTSAPGMIALGLLPSSGSVDLLTSAMNVSPGVTFSLPSMTIHKAASGTAGAFEVVWRPEDVTSWELDRGFALSAPGSVNNISGVFTAGIDMGPYMAIAGLGLPPSTVIYYEFITHLECTQINSTGTVATGEFEAQTVRGEGQVPSLEMLYSSIVNNLGPASRAISDAIISASPTVMAAHKAYTSFSKGLKSDTLRNDYVM